MLAYYLSIYLLLLLLLLLVGLEYNRLLQLSSITPDIVKNLRRGQTVTVKKRDSNNWTVTV